MTDRKSLRALMDRMRGGPVINDVVIDLVVAHMSDQLNAIEDILKPLNSKSTKAQMWSAIQAAKQAAGEG